MWCIFRANFSVMCLKHPRCPGLGCHIDSLVRASCHQLTTASSFSCCSRRLCHRCTPARETASQDCTLWQRMSLSYLLLGLTFRQKLQLGCFFDSLKCLNAIIGKCCWGRNLDSFQVLVVVLDLSLGCQDLSPKKTMLQGNHPFHLSSSKMTSGEIQKVQNFKQHS